MHEKKLVISRINDGTYREQYKREESGRNKDRGKADTSGIVTCGRHNAGRQISTWRASHLEREREERRGSHINCQVDWPLSLDQESFTLHSYSPPEYSFPLSRKHARDKPLLPMWHPSWKNLPPSIRRDRKTRVVWLLTNESIDIEIGE